MVGDGAHISIDGVTIFHFYFLFKFGSTIKPLFKKKQEEERKEEREGGRERQKERKITTNEKQQHLAPSAL